MATQNSRNNLPFKVEVSIAGRSIETQLVIELRGRGEKVSFEDINEVLSYFIAAADAGMFCGEQIPPTQSSMKILSRDLTQPAALRCSCSVRGIDPGAYRILLNMLVQSYYDLEPLENVRLLSITQSDEMLGLDAIFSLPFPGRFTPLPFDLVVDEFGPEHKERIIRINFQRALRQEEFNRLDEIIADWDSIVVMGGYLDTFDETDDIPFYPGETYLMDPKTVEHTIYVFDAPEDAFNAVINMAAKLHVTFCPLVQLEIQ